MQFDWLNFNALWCNDWLSFKELKAQMCRDWLSFKALFVYSYSVV
jgi:hypothetical protein